MLVELFAQLRLDVEQDAVRKDEDIGVGQDASLRGEKESVAALAGLELLYMVGGHGVQQAHAIFAGEKYLSPRGEIQVSCCFTKSSVTGSHIVSVTDNPACDFFTK